jgi:hypothetical protein
MNQARGIEAVRYNPEDRLQTGDYPFQPTLLQKQCAVIRPAGGAVPANQMNTNAYESD